MILDGPGPSAAAAALRMIDPHAADHCLPAQQLLDLALTSADGTAALAALSVVKLAGAVLDPEA